MVINGHYFSLNVVHYSPLLWDMEYRDGHPVSGRSPCVSIIDQNPCRLSDLDSPNPNCNYSGYFFGPHDARPGRTMGPTEEGTCWASDALSGLNKEWIRLRSLAPWPSHLSVLSSPFSMIEEYWLLRPQHPLSDSADPRVWIPGCGRAF